MKLQFQYLQLDAELPHLLFGFFFPQQVVIKVSGLSSQNPYRFQTGSDRTLWGIHHCPQLHAALRGSHPLNMVQGQGLLRTYFKLDFKHKTDKPLLLQSDLVLETREPGSGSFRSETAPPESACFCWCETHVCLTTLLVWRSGLRMIWFIFCNGPTSRWWEFSLYGKSFVHLFHTTLIPQTLLWITQWNFNQLSITEIKLVNTFSSYSRCSTVLGKLFRILFLFLFCMGKHVLKAVDTFLHWWSLSRCESYQYQRH